MNLNLKIVIDDQMTLNFHSEFIEVGLGPARDDHYMLFKVPRDRLSESIREKARIIFETPHNGHKTGVVSAVQAQNSHVLVTCRFTRNTLKRNRL